MPKYTRSAYLRHIAGANYMGKGGGAALMRHTAYGEGKHHQPKYETRVMGRNAATHRTGAPLSLGEKIVANSPWGNGHEQLTRVAPVPTPVAGIVPKSTSQAPIKGRKRDQVHSVYAAGPEHVSAWQRRDNWTLVSGPSKVN